jgi:hypothetical protein
MNADVFAEWLRRQGYDVLRTESSYWYEASRRVYQAFPFHWVIEPEEDELVDMLRSRRAVALRYSTPVGAPVGRISYHAIYDKPSYELNDLDRRSRQNVRKGVERCRVEQISIERLAEDGWLLEMDTSNRQGRQAHFSKDAWCRRYMAAADLPGFEAWGAIVENRLVASLFMFQMDDCCELISQQCDREYLNARVNNALSFEVTQTMVRRRGILLVFYALQSLDAPSSVDQFKFRMGYRAKPVRQRVVFHPWISPLVNRASHAGLRWLRERWQDKALIRKAEGMVRFYLSGKTSAREQDWPECLSRSKEEMLSKLNFQVRQ